MSMKIVVCIKQVAAPDEEVEFNEDGNDIDPDYLDRALNEWDGYATEQALRIREAVGDGEVVAVTLGDDRLRRGPAQVPGHGCRPRDPGRGRDGHPRPDLDRPSRWRRWWRPSSPTWCCAACSRATRSTAPQVGPWRSSSTCRAWRWSPQSPTTTAGCSATVDRELEGGLVDVAEVRTPALLTIQTGASTPRYVTFRAIKDADRKPLDVVAVDVAGEPAWRVRRMFLPPRPDGAHLLEGDPAMIAQRIAELVRERLT